MGGMRVWCRDAVTGGIVLVDGKGEQSRREGRRTALKACKNASGAKEVGRDTIWVNVTVEVGLRGGGKWERGTMLSGLEYLCGGCERRGGREGGS